MAPQLPCLHFPCCSGPLLSAASRQLYVAICPSTGICLSCGRLEPGPPAVRACPLVADSGPHAVPTMAPTGSLVPPPPASARERPVSTCESSPMVSFSPSLPQAPTTWSSCPDLCYTQQLQAIQASLDLLEQRLNTRRKC